MRLVNLLPWRPRLARQRLRFWAVMMSGMLMAMLAVHGYRMAMGYQDARRQSLLSESDSHRREWLTQALEQAGARQRQYEAQQLEDQRRRARRVQVLAWRDAVLALAALLPDGVWLTRLEGDEARWRITGMARSSSALIGLEQALSQDSDFRQPRAGSLVRQGPGEWRFGWQFGLSHDVAAP